MRVSIAKARPTTRARGCCATGSLAARMEMKMMLSMPSTSSSSVRVAKATHISGSRTHSMPRLLRLGSIWRFQRGLESQTR